MNREIVMNFTPKNSIRCNQSKLSPNLREEDAENTLKGKLLLWNFGNWNRNAGLAVRPRNKPKIWSQHTLICLVTAALHNHVPIVWPCSLDLLSRAFKTNRDQIFKPDFSPSLLSWALSFYWMAFLHFFWASGNTIFFIAAVLCSWLDSRSTWSTRTHHGNRRVNTIPKACFQLSKQLKAGLLHDLLSDTALRNITPSHSSGQ